MEHFFAPRNAVLFLLVMAPVFIWARVAILSEKIMRLRLQVIKSFAMLNPVENQGE